MFRMSAMQGWRRREPEQRTPLTSESLKGFEPEGSRFRATAVRLAPVLIMHPRTIGYRWSSSLANPGHK